MYRSKYWSCFDAIAQVRRKKVAVLSYHDIKWPKGLEFVYSPFSIIALQGDVKYAQVEFGEDGNPISIDMFEDGKSAGATIMMTEALFPVLLYMKTA